METVWTGGDSGFLLRAFVGLTHGSALKLLVRTTEVGILSLYAQARLT